MDIRIEFEAKKQMQDVASEFKGKLSETEIKKSAAFTINVTMKRVTGLLRRNVRRDYTVKPKYLKRAINTKKKASSDSLFGVLSYDPNPIPLIGFKASKSGRKKFYAYKNTSKVTVEIKKGVKKIIEHAFMKQMPNGHQGVYMHGWYRQGGFKREDLKTSSGKYKITELKTTSPFAMFSSNKIKSDIENYVDSSIAGRYRAILENKINRMK